MKQLREINSEYWWITHQHIEEQLKSGLVSHTFVREQAEFGSVRKAVWFWFKRACASERLSASAKIILWAICERWQFQSFSSHDAVSYYSIMVGVNRRSAGRAIQQLIEEGLIWCVLEGEPNRVFKKSQSSGKKHFLLVGLGSLLRG